ncbi:cell wall-binding repeat-containing protein [Ornithinimicrobium cavernae]|uniref:cell wall-binding repeat-containing protein n=1 Tax=Ornithinimicrobium cavernae TaxID=2666047 RepID=UPI000D689857|nr:cell wall-binding repeat-containing protein [Ornithinimicrobium cavernae]
MRTPTLGKRARIAAFAASAVVVSPLAIGTISAQADGVADLQPGETKTYIVQLADQPLVAFDGGNGLAATAPKAGEKVDVDSAAAEAYTDYLGAQRSEVLSTVGLSSSDVVTTYDTALNGFAVRMNNIEAAHMRKAPGVVQVWEDEIRHADTVQTPDYLGLSGEGGVWEEQFGGVENAGEGVIVGVIDTGIDPLNPSFAGEGFAPAPADWNGSCDEAGTDWFGAFECNDKLIGARWYGAEYGNTVIEGEYTSARDRNGHGSHTAGTSAGNFDVPLSIMGHDLGSASGMAPSAYVAVYKGLWMTPDGNGSGTTAGLVQAIDDAVADGVDVINYSISGSSTSIVGPDEVAFLFAADAGIFVSTSAGNSGDTVGESSVAHNAPWTTTVAASTHNRGAVKTVTLGETDADPVDRWGGADRYETAALVAAEFGDSVDTVYIATGDEYADALTGSPSAAQGLAPGVAPSDALTPAPVLLSRPDHLPAATRASLETIEPTNIVLLGGNSAVSDEVAEEIAAYGTVTRVEGSDRYETAVSIAEMYGAVDRIYVANGADFPDALTGAALAGHLGAPIVLTQTDNVPTVLEEYLATENASSAEIVVIGGEGAVSADVFTELGASDRLSGGDRYETAVAVSQAFGTTEPEVTFVASGEAFPDALAASALAASLGVPVQLTQPTHLPNAVGAELTRLAPQGAVVLGGEAAVSAGVETTVEGLLTAGDDAPTYTGVGVGDGVTGSVIDAATIPAEGVTAEDAALCLLGSVDDAAAAGNIVLCTRGSNARVEKSQEVAESGGIGMIQVNNNDQESLNADFHHVPSIHLNGTDGAAVKAWVAENDPAVVTISAQSTDPVNAPEMAGFSSYGPALAGNGDLLKPDITAPGVDVAAAYHADHEDPSVPTFNQISGTSMSAPHIAGLAALMKQEFPDWSPAAIKSAMMTTARDTMDSGDPIQRSGADASPLDYGAGEVVPGKSYNPGLVFDAGFDDWLLYLCSVHPSAVSGCPEVVPDASDLNYPSISIGELAGVQTVTRTVTDVTGEGGTYTARVEAPEGLSITVEPATIVVPAGGEASFEVTIESAGAATDTYHFAQLRLVNGDVVVESPIAVQPTALAAPAEISGDTAEGSADYQAVTGYAGVVNAEVDGLAVAEVLPTEVTSDGPGGGESIADSVTEITVPEGTHTLRVSVFDAETDPAGIDIDMYLANSAGQVIAQSAVGGSDESVTLHDVEAGTYLIALDYWDGAAGATATVPTYVWAVGDTAEGNLTVTPETAPATVGGTVDYSVAWTGLEAGTRYLGAVNYSNGTDPVGKTLVSVNTP